MQQTSDNSVITSGADALCRIGAEFHSRGWSLGTSSNYSIRLSDDPLKLLITASGKDKSQLSQRDFVIVDDRGAMVEKLDQGNKPSAETLLHLVVADCAGAGAVLHTHSVWATTLSDLYCRQGFLELNGYEMLKGLEGIGSHEHVERLTIFENTQDMTALAGELRERLKTSPDSLKYGFLLRRHGLYAWGRDLAQARRHIEILEFLFEVVGRNLLLKNALNNI